MKVQSFLAVLLALALAPAFGESPYPGKWAGTMEGKGGGEVPIEVALLEGSGTFRMASQSASARKNPCMGKDLPLTYEAAGDSIRLDIKGAKVIAGCIDQPATLTHANGQLSGALKDGRKVSLTRK